MTHFSDIVQCYSCKRTSQRVNTLILETPKGRFRICRDCYVAYGTEKLTEELTQAKKTVDLYGLKDTDAFDIMDKKKKFIEDIKKGVI